MINVVVSEHDLEDHILTLRKLDQVRRRSATLRNEGIKFLKSLKYGNVCSQVLQALFSITKFPSDVERKELIDSFIEKLQTTDLKKFINLNDFSDNEFSFKNLPEDVDECKRIKYAHAISMLRCARELPSNNNNEDRQDRIKLIDDFIKELKDDLNSDHLDQLMMLKYLPDDWLVRRSLLVRAVTSIHDISVDNEAENENYIQGSVEELEKEITLEDLAENRLSVIVAANTLQALFAQPGAAFSKTGMLCCYWVIRELYTADYGDWSIGSARAAPGGFVTAFTTGECMHALLSFSMALRNTGNFIAEIDSYIKRNEELDNLLKQVKDINEQLDLKAWVEAEKKQLEISCFLELKRLSRYLLLPFIKLDTVDTVINYFTSNKAQKNGDASGKNKDFVGATNSVEENLGSVLHEINTYRDKENLVEGKTKTDEIRQQCSRTQSAHKIAEATIYYALEWVTKAKDLLKKTPIDYEKLKEIFDEAAHKVDNLRHAIKNYQSSVLDRELALIAMEKNADSQPVELAFAAASYGWLTEWKKDDRLKWAVRELSKAISSRGRFTNQSTYHRDRKSVTTVANGAVLHALAQLLRRVPISDNISDNELAQFAEKMLHFFEDTSAPQGGWGSEYSRPPIKADTKFTALAVIALAEINAMLDVSINDIIFEHFTVKRKNRGLDVPLLDKLFYPDYGLGFAKILAQRPKGWDEKDWPRKIGRKCSVALTLQRMRAHVLRLSLSQNKNDQPGQQNSKDNSEECHLDPIYSLVLHGPAGTGKTTLVESLAMTCDVPLVEVTPSDLIKRGEESIEQRARVVFEALSMLTRVVILFDEFDPVLKRRDVNNKNPLSVFSFLTPGMLPKLKNLHNEAEKRSVAYVLITNLIGDLDEAAVRQGRFDERLGIYPPDLLSRAGRLLDQLFIYCNNPNNSSYKKINWDHLIEVIQKTGGVGMTALGKRGWFTEPKKKHPDNDTPFDYILNSGNKESNKDWLNLEPDDVLKMRGVGRTAVKEYLQWKWIDKCDQLLSKDKIQMVHLCDALKQVTGGKLSLGPLDSFELTNDSRDSWEVMAGFGSFLIRRFLIRPLRRESDSAKKKQ